MEDENIEKIKRKKIDQQRKAIEAKQLEEQIKIKKFYQNSKESIMNIESSIHKAPILT